MSTSPTSTLSKPEDSNNVSLGTLGYIRARNRQRAYNLVIKEFKKSGITQATLAKRLGKAAEVISRLLSRPRNLELDTFSDLMFAISGAVPRYEATYPLRTGAQEHLEKGLGVYRMDYTVSGAHSVPLNRDIAVYTETCPLTPLKIIRTPFLPPPQTEAPASVGR